MDKTKISRFLSLVLRHKPQVLGLNLDEHGWCSVEQLIKKMNENGRKIDRALLESIVREDNKQRYSFNEDGTCIRANQGHSVRVDLELKSVKPPKVLYHGTVKRFLDSILKTGIQKGNRQHVHLSGDIDTATNVGSRRGKPVIIEVDSQRMYNDGFEFYISENKVWLTYQVPVEYISKIKE